MSVQPPTPSARAEASAASVPIGEEDDGDRGSLRIKTSR
jgi:hypothetical protein